MTDQTRPTLPMPLEEALMAVEAEVTNWLSVEAYQAVLDSGHTPTMLATSILVALYGQDAVAPLLTYPASKSSPFDEPS